MNFVLKKLSFLLLITSTAIFAQQPHMADFVGSVLRYDQIIIAMQHPDKTYEQLPSTLGKISGITLWTYGIYRGLSEADMCKIFMATITGLTFGVSVAAVSKIVVEESRVIKWTYKLYAQEVTIHTLANLLNLNSEDIAKLDITGYNE